ncbi:MAG: hypothetical protein KY475_09685 [Planctomycetes bacterium]|nr:hypothetical protein [Planctomycetota bacterium]
MLRNLMVTGTAAVVMALMTLAYQSAAPPTAQPTMEDGAAAGPEERPMPGSATSDPTASSPGLAMGGQTPQAAQSPSVAAAPGGGIMGGAPATGGMMMCPCMQMMMGGGMGGMMNQGMSGGQAAPSSAAPPISNPRTTEQARERAAQYLRSLGNPHLKVGDVEETAAAYEIDVTTQDDSLVNRLILDKQTGELKTQY